jgi:uncharacterized membrane protein
MNPTTKQRNSTADLLKGLAVVFMILVHLVELFAKPEVYTSLLGKISLFLGGPPAAPVFMVVMGYFIARSKRSLSSNLLRGAKLIALGFALNIGLNFHLLIRIGAGSIDVNPWPYIFGVDILFLAGLSIIVLSTVKYFAKLNLIPWVLLLAVIFVFQYFSPSATTINFQTYFRAYFFGEGIWWAYFPLIPWLAYPVSGVIVYILLFRFEKVFDRFYLYLIISGGIISFAFIGYASGVTSILEDYYNHGLLFFVYTCCFLVFYGTITSLLSKSKTNRVSNWLEWLGKNVTSAYVIQWLLIGNIATGVYKTQSLLETVLWFFAILLMTSLGVVAWEKFRKKDVGV